MKTISSFSSKLLALTLALMAGVSSFAYDEMPDFQVDGLYYNFLEEDNVEVTHPYIPVVPVENVASNTKKKSHAISADDYYNLTNLVIPSTVTYEGKVYNVTRIGFDAFNQCDKLTFVDIPSSVKTIGVGAFNFCSSLTSITLKEGLEHIEWNAFEDCRSLENITFPNSLKTIGNYAFSNTLWYKNHPNGGVYAGNVFYKYKGDIPQNTSFVIKEGTVSISPYAFVKENYHEDYSLVSVSIPNSVEVIGEGAFYRCRALISIVIPTGVTTIETLAFHYCKALKFVTCEAVNPPALSGSVFMFTPITDATLYVPAESLEAYKAAMEWKDFGQILPINTPSYKSQWCDTWNVMWFDGMRFDETASTTKYRLGKDTIIGDYTYSKFTSSTSVRFTDDRKVYVYYEGFDDNDPYSEDLPTGEYLAYDFSAQVGDTLEVFSGVTYNTKTYKCVVYDVQTDLETNLLTIKLHPLVVVDGNGNVEVSSEEITWIEGVGSPRGFLIGTTLPGGGLYTLLCAYQDDELKYTGSFYERFGCDYKAGVVSDDLFPMLSGLQRTICREYCEQADNKTRIEQFTNLTTRTETGGPYIYCSPFLLREKDNKILIYSRSLNKDLVLYDFNLQVGDSLPMLYIDFFAKDDWIPDSDMEIWYVVDYQKDLEGNILPADTLIVTDVSMITLLNGKEYKKWTFNNGMEYVEGIGSFGNDQWSGDFFQLIANKGVPTSLLGEHLVCVSKNNKLLYQMDAAEMERLGAECLCEVEKKWSDTWCDTWNVLELKYSYNSYTTKEDFETWRYYLAQDTIINNYTYTAVTRQTTKVPEGVYPFTIPEPEYVAAVRFTDDRKVYIYYDNTEYLLYDFNVQPGDELTVFAGINHYHSHHTNTIRVDEVERYPGIYPFGTEISLSVFPDFSGDVRPTCFGVTKWVEGVGDLCGFITGADCGLSEYQTALLCAYKDGNTEYRTEYEEYTEYGCEYNSGENKEYILTLPGLQRTGCTKTIGENENGTVWGSRSYLMQEIETATIDGKQYLLFGTNNIYDEYCSLWLREENNKILLYSTAQKKDLVLYDFTLNVGDSLPRLYVNYDLSSVVDYDNDEWGLSPLVVTEVSTITLLDGKEYKKWTFDNGMQYVEGIGSFGTCYAHNDFYQLIANAPRYSDVYSQHLVCTSRNGQLLYQMDDAEMERLGAECLCDVEKKWSDTWCNQWNILSHGYQGPQYPLVAAHTSIFWLSNNTVNRNGQEYIPLMCSSSKPDVESTSFIGELRFTKDKQVYFNYDLDKTEYLLYDFGAQVGDTLELFAGLEFYDYHKIYTHVITSKDTLNDGRLQIQADVIIRIDNGAGEVWEEKHPVIWIEGLGSKDGIIFNSANPGVAGDAAIIMLCAYRDDECVYKTDSNDPYWIDYTQLGCVYNEGDFIEGAFPILSGLQRTVCNEYCGETEDDNSANNTYKQTFDSIFFENDKPYILCDGYLLREEENKILIYSQILNKDLVLYDFTLEVGDSLPALYIDYQQHNAMDWMPYNIGVVDYNIDHGGTIYPADTFVVTDISSVTLLDGKEYKKWTFDNGMEYVEGIGMYGGHRNGNFFGLIQEIVVPCHTGTHLVCVSKNGKLLYQMDDAEMERLGTECLCDYDSGHRKDNAKDGQIGGRPTPTQWNQLEVVLREMDNNHTILQAETFSYTLEDISQQVNNKTYFQLARQSTKDTATTKSVVGALHFGKDEDNRVYFLRDEVEYVLYDFTAEPGDTVEIFAGINNYPQETTYTHVVTGKDTLENGACRMLLEVVFPDDTNTTAENAEKVWLAGLGSLDGIVHNAAKRTSNAHAAPNRSADSNETESSVMLCAWREDSCLYTTDHPDYDSFGCVYNQDPTSVENTHSPLPMTNCQKIIRNEQLLILHEGKTYNVLGIVVE